MACTKPIGLLSSCATPATSWPSERIFSLCMSCAWVSFSSRVRSSTRASSVSLSFAISSNALAFSIAIALWFASVRSSWRSSAMSPSPENLRPTAITPSRSTPKRIGTSRLDLEHVEDVAAGVARLGVGRVVEVDARQLLAAHPELLADRVVDRQLEAQRVVVELAAPRRGPQALRLVVEQQHHARARCPCCSVTAASRRSTTSSSESIETIASEISRTASR